MLSEGTGLGNIIYDHGNNGLVLLEVVMAGLLAKTMGTKLIIFIVAVYGIMVMVVILAPMITR